MLAAASVCTAFFGLASGKQAIIFTRPMLVSILKGLIDIEPATFYWIARSKWKNFFNLMSRSLQLQNSKAKVCTLHQQIYWLLISDQSILEYLYLSQTLIMRFSVFIPRGGGGGGKPQMKGGGAGELRIWKGWGCLSSRTGVNFGFWSHLGCSGQNAIIFSREGLI